MITLLAPGQGSQTPGMLTPWLDDPAAEESLDRWSASIGLDLRRLGTTADADEIRDTAVTQPLIVAASLLAAARLVAQVTLPVRWDSCMATLRGLGVTAVIELPPAGALVGLVRRELKGTATLALKTPDDLDKAVELIREHSEEGS